MLRQPYEQQSGGVLGTLQSVKDTYEKDLKERLFWMVSGVWCMPQNALENRHFFGGGQKTRKTANNHVWLEGDRFPPAQRTFDALDLGVDTNFSFGFIWSFFVHHLFLVAGCWMFTASPIFSPGAARS